jgi:hypothetical protein
MSSLARKLVFSPGSIIRYWLSCITTSMSEPDRAVRPFERNDVAVAAYGFSGPNSPSQ